MRDAGQDAPPKGAENHPVLLRLQSYVRLSPDLTDRIYASMSRVVRQPARTELQSEGQSVRQPRWLVSGWGCRYRQTSDGRRLIYDVVLPGEGVGVCLKLKPIARTSTLALTPVTLADAGEWVEPEILNAQPALAAALEAAAEADEERLLQHAFRLGRMSAIERLADLVLDLHDRLERVHLTRGPFLPMPLTQETLSDMLGLSVVHVNRTLQELRRRELLTVARNEARILDRKQLALLVDRE